MFISDLRNALIELYRENQSKIPLFTFAEHMVVPLEDLYVMPQMEAIDLYRHSFSHSKTPVADYQQLLLHKGIHYNNLYLTANAGVGKTAFCQRICMAWCQAHNEMPLLAEMFKDEEISTMKTYDFLFLLPLRDVDRSLCHLDEMIETTIVKYLPSKYNNRRLLENILDEKSCLVILDGLDEWKHPPSCTKQNTELDIPHRKSRKNWTIVTTTRPWKLDLLRLPCNQIGRHVELNELKEKSSHELVSKAINLLNKGLDKSGKKIEDFFRTASSKNLKEISSVPYIYLQCVGLWYDNWEIGRSKCEIYTNVMEITLFRGTGKIKQALPQTHEISSEIPICIEGKEQCKNHWKLLLKLGKLAFDALFGNENRQILVMDGKFAAKYLEHDLDYCLKLGLMSQNKVYGPVSKTISNVSFQHKTLHEYLAALYMVSDEKSQASIVEACSTLAYLLETSNVFIFLSGFNAAAYTHISRQLMGIVNKSEYTQRYRSRFENFAETCEYEALFKYQTLQVNCVQEMELNDPDFPHLPPLEDVIINKSSNRREYLSYLQKLTKGTSGNIKSLSVRDSKDTNNVTDILNRLDLQHFHSLEKLELHAVTRQPELERLLGQSVNSLKCLAIRNINSRYLDDTYIEEMKILSNTCLENVLSMPQLQSVCLECLKLSHDQLEKVTKLLKSRPTMTQIGLENIVCSDHEVPCIVLDLCKHDDLQLLILQKVLVSQLTVNTNHLEDCWIGRLDSRTIRSCLTCLPDAQSLRILYIRGLCYTDVPTLIETIPKLLQLKEIYIHDADLRNNIIVMETDMKRLEYFELLRVSMTSSDVQALADTVSRQTKSIIVMLWQCKITPKAKFELVKKDIGCSDRFVVTFNGKSTDGYLAFRFQTKK